MYKSTKFLNTARCFIQLKIKSLKSETGLTLIEIMASMMIFLVVSAGVAGTLTSGLRATASTSSGTAAKARAQEQMEEMRSRVFYVPYSSDPDIGSTADVDLLDHYFPGLTSTSISGWIGTYTGGSDAHYTVVSPVDDEGRVVTVETRFVNNAGQTIIPASTYNTDIEGDDTPPSNLVAVKLAVAWSDHSNEKSYQLDSLISATGQAVRGSADTGGSGGDDEQGCNSTSRSYVDSIGGKFAIFSGLVEPYTEVISGNIGEGYASVETGCENQVIGRGTSGNYTIGGTTQKTAEASAVGPPNDTASAGPTSVGPLSGWPTVSVADAFGDGVVQAEDLQSMITAEGEARLGGMSASISQVDGWPGSIESGYRQWDFLNPVVQVMGPGDDDEFFANLQQEGLHAEGVAKIQLPQINILPLQAKTANTPSALQGLIFIRNFTAEVHSYGGEGTGTSTVTYSATIGTFNPSKAASCSADDCYDHYIIDQSNPLQVRIDLNNVNYRLQKALFTGTGSQFHSLTTTEIAAALFGDATKASVNIDALIKLSASIGTEIRWDTENPHKDDITLINELGYGDFLVGGFSVALNEAQAP